MFDNYVHMLTPSLLFITPGIAHRDLKPENILCESPEKVLGLVWDVTVHVDQEYLPASMKGVRSPPGRAPRAA
jgi:serine/threonine protein kinase